MGEYLLFLLLVLITLSLGLSKWVLHLINNLINMYLWERILELNEEQQNAIFSNYQSPYYSPEVRHVIAHWIEDTFRVISFHLDSKNPSHIPEIHNIIENLIRELDLKAESVATFRCVDVRESIRQTAMTIRNHFPIIAVDLFEHIRHCLHSEYEFLQKVKTHDSPLIYNNKLIKPEEYNWNIFRRMEVCQHEINQIYNQWLEFRNGTTVTPNTLEVRMQELISILENLVKSFNNKLSKYCTDLQSQLNAITLKIQKWKDEKQKLYQGKLIPLPGIELNDLQVHCEYCVNRLWCLRELLKKVWQLNNKRSINLHTEEIYKFDNWVHEKLVELVEQSLVVLIQPSTITRTNTITKPTLQLLVGDKIRSCQTIKVYCYMVNEIQAFDIIRNNYQRPKTEDACCKLENNNTEFQTSTEGNAYIANFRNTKLAEFIERLYKKQIFGINKVSDENNWFYFHSEFVVDNIPFKICTFSYPVKIITNGNQECEFWETAIWDITAGRLGVESVSKRPLEVPWRDFALALSAWFYRQTGRDLTNEHTTTIAIKMLSFSYGLQIQQDPLTVFSLSDLRKEVIPGYSTTCTFWKWIFSMMKLILEQLTGEKRNQITRPGLWETEAVVGFITEAKSAEILSREPEGTFLIRFSYSTPGALTVDFFSNGQIRSNRNTTDDLKCRSILNRISDIPEWKILYPKMLSKAELLSKYILPADTTVSPLVKPYVKAGIIARLENQNG